MASIFQFPGALRRLFATILVFCEPGDVSKLWDDHYEALSEDYRRTCGSIERVKQLVLTNIKYFLQSMGKNIQNFDLPELNEDLDLEGGGFREVNKEFAIAVEDEHLLARDSLNVGQKAAFQEIMRHVNGNQGGVFFIDGPGGTGKYFSIQSITS